jgi:integrase
VAGRHPLALGTWGSIRTWPAAVNDKGKPTRWRARTIYRDIDGRSRQIERWGRSATDAENKLKTALMAKNRMSREGELSGADRFAKAAEIWRQTIEAHVRRGTRSPGTLETYERSLKLHVLPALGEVRLLEIAPPLLDRFLKTVSNSAGAPTAKLCRSVISGTLGLAVRYGALATNPVRDADRLSARPAKEPRALTLEERQLLLKKLAADPVACAAGVPELVRFMLATGQRIGECLGVLWQEVDLAQRQVEVNSTVIRWTGHGLVRKDTKTRAGRRILVLPSWAVADLQRRWARGVRLEEPVFSNSLGGLRDPKNTRRDVRAALDHAGFNWVTSHSLRKTTATMLDEAGLSARVIADQLGHARPSMTQDVYMGRKVVDARVAAALEDALGKTPPDEAEAKSVNKR